MAEKSSREFTVPSGCFRRPRRVAALGLRRAAWPAQKQVPKVLAPDEILDFATLYAENCSGCHGAEGRGGAAIALANPVYLAIANDEVVCRRSSPTVFEERAMPAFAQ